jgi:hypothetical protein
MLSIDTLYMTTGQRTHEVIDQVPAIQARHFYSQHQCAMTAAPRAATQSDSYLPCCTASNCEPAAWLALDDSVGRGLDLTTRSAVAITVKEPVRHIFHTSAPSAISNFLTASEERGHKALLATGVLMRSKMPGFNRECNRGIKEHMGMQMRVSS